MLKPLQEYTLQQHVCGCFIFESAKNTQLIDSKNKQVQGF